jgi:hypothetical protein
MLQRQRPFSGSNVGRKGQRWSKQLQQQSIGAGAVRTPYPETTRQINTEAPTDVLYDAVIVGGVLRPRGGGCHSNSSSDCWAQPEQLHCRHVPQQQLGYNLKLRMAREVSQQSRYAYCQSPTASHTEFHTVRCALGCKAALVACTAVLPATNICPQLCLPGTTLHVEWTL